ncbi:uncharacterized protein LOC142612025 [Castanea sativa]|uniref:uncharacterized protein LOC142612025 n=1 Tax=Castanea sativa TaxID=21020 RepID=UPI003F65034C
MDVESNPHPNPAFVKWQKSDRLVKGWLTATLSEEVLGIVVGLNTSVEVWNALVHAFARVSSDRSLALKQRLTSMTRGIDTLAVYLRRFKAVCDDLAAIGKLVTDEKKSWWLLNGLGKEYAMFTTTMLRPPVLPYSEIVTLLESYAKRHNLDAQPAPQMVFYALKCFNRFNHSISPDDIPKALVAIKIADNQDSEWFANTGATDHITDDLAIIGTGVSSIKLNDVLLVPDIKKNLLSVSKLTTDFPFTFEFDGLGFVIKDMTTNQIVAKGCK